VERGLKQGFKALAAALGAEHEVNDNVGEGL
jgi:hypothetical protein